MVKSIFFYSYHIVNWVILMNYLKLLGKSFLYMIIILFASTIIITLLNYINIFGNKLTTLAKIVISVISFFTGGFIMGKNSKQKGWLEGIKIGSIIIVILLLLNYIILKQSFDLKNIVFYLILLSSSIFGSMIGINKNVENP